MSLQKGIELFNRGLYWEAHEAWEEVWMPDRHGPDRGFYKGLIQIAAGCLHCQRRNRRGALSKLRSGVDYLHPYLPSHHGVDLAALVAQAEVCRARVEAMNWPAAFQLPVIERAASE
jgi:predicted metal-dependent hydrolase